MKLSFLKYENHIAKHESLICIHGLLGSKNNFRSIFKHPHLASQIQNTYLIDLRNHGGSFHHPSSQISDMAEDVYNFIQEHNLTNPVIMGHSLGGKVVMQLLSQYPIFSFKAAIVVDIPPLGKKNPTHDAYYETKKILETIRNINIKQTSLNNIKEQFQKSQISKDVAYLVLSSLTPISGSVTNVSQVQDFQWKFNIEHLCNNYDQIVSTTVKAASYVPRLVIFGQNSPYKCNPNIFNTVFSDFDSNRDFVEIEKAKHWVHFDNTVQFIDVLQNYLKRLD